MVRRLGWFVFGLTIHFHLQLLMLTFFYTFVHEWYRHFVLQNIYFILFQPSSPSPKIKWSSPQLILTNIILNLQNVYNIFPFHYQKWCIYRFNKTSPRARKRNFLSIIRVQEQTIIAKHSHYLISIKCRKKRKIRHFSYLGFQIILLHLFISICQIIT